MANNVTVTNNFDGDFTIVIKHNTSNGYVLQTPIVEDGVKWETERQGSPGKLTFKVYTNRNSDLEFEEGDAVSLSYRESGKDWQILFSGYIFTKKRNKDGWVDVTAYDLLRYFKNKHTYVFKDVRASDVLKQIVEDFKLPIGTIEATDYVIGERVEDDQSLFDIIQNALDLTLVGTGTMYAVYADSTGVCLRNVNNMKTDLIINESSASDFDYTSSIDEQTYNDIELYYDNDETNSREYYHAFSTDKMNVWGRLRLTESIKSPANAEDRAKKMLQLYNRETKKLKVKDAFGDYRCRAGASVIVQLNLGDTTVNNYMLIEKATHTFKKDEYRMELTLGGTTEFTA